MIGTLIVKQKVAGAFKALNRRDLDTFLKDYSVDATFVYPGDLSASGTHAGKEAIRLWFKRFLEQFPQIQFNVKHVTIENLFDMTGSNTATVYWENEVTNRDGLTVHNSGMTLITTKFGKAIFVQDFLFNTGDQFRAAWGEGKLVEESSGQ